MTPRSRNKVVAHCRVLGHPFGVYLWSRHGASGVVVRLGPVGHVQLQEYRCAVVGKRADGRRGKHGVKLSVWGTSGRRRKRSLEVAVHL